MYLVYVIRAQLILSPNHYDPLWTLSLPENCVCYSIPTPSGPVCALYVWLELNSSCPPTIMTPYELFSPVFCILIFGTPGM